MIAIRFSPDEKYGGELDLSSSPKVLRNVGQSILSLIRNEIQQSIVIEAATIDPAPYRSCLSALVIRKTAALTKVSVSATALQIEGTPENLKTLASWFNFDDTTPSGYHAHFDSLDNEESVDPTSIPLVISVRN
jgi:hypothetical protein